MFLPSVIGGKEGLPFLRQRKTHNYLSLPDTRQPGLVVKNQARSAQMQYVAALYVVLSNKDNHRSTNHYTRKN